MEHVRNLSEHIITHEPGFRYHYGGPANRNGETDFDGFQEPDYVSISRRAERNYREGGGRWEGNVGNESTEICPDCGRRVKTIDGRMPRHRTVAEGPWCSYNNPHIR